MSKSKSRADRFYESDIAKEYEARRKRSEIDPDTMTKGKAFGSTEFESGTSRKASRSARGVGPGNRADGGER